MRRALLLAALLIPPGVPARSEGLPAFEVWRLSNGGVAPLERAGEPLPVGSLQKAWVVKAWGEAHSNPSVPLPRLVCGKSSRCWNAEGHGAVDLRAATALSCNAYFRELAESTPEPFLRSALLSAGFLVPEPIDSDAAIGLESGPSVTISPRDLLLSYAFLVKTPWLARDDARAEWLDGMRDAAERGTAEGIPLRGLLAKTGTVPSLDGAPLKTSGWVLVLDPAGGSGALALLRQGTGSRAAARLGGLLAQSLALLPPKALRVARPRNLTSESGTHAERPVRVRLFAALTLGTERTRVLARNAGDRPATRKARTGSGWVGPGAEIELLPGDRLGDSTWELHVSPFDLVRVVCGSVASGARVLPLVLETTARDYVEGVLRGELRRGPPERAEELAAAILRRLAEGPWHGREDVCDLTHCGRFAGLGPDVEWVTPVKARISTDGAFTPPPSLGERSWRCVLEAARLPGPTFWTSHCGGEPLAPRAVWGGSGNETVPCPRHAGAGSAPWSRTYTASRLATAFGERVLALEAAARDGVLFTRVVLASGERLVFYDELHARLAATLGWNSLPSPPDRIERTAGGWRASGRGAGHRVGLCLAE